MEAQGVAAEDRAAVNGAVAVVATVGIAAVDEEEVSSE